MADTDDEVVDRFEQASRNGPPDLNEFLTDVSEAPTRRRLLTQLIPIDLERRWTAGDGQLVEDYLSRFPELMPTDPAIIVAEFQARGHSVPVEEYRRRFPELWPKLAPLLDAAGQETRSIAPPVIDGYDVTAEIGRGGSGVVYRAFDRKLRREVALKVLHGGAYAGQDLVRRFYTEARAGASLHHPNIAHVYDVGEQAGDLYLALELVEGVTLAELIKAREFAPREAAAIVETLARAVDYAHAQGVVHRDLKPANVLVAGVDHSLLRPEALKIVDLGLAKQLGGAYETRSHTVVGTPAYMAPEQVSGNSKEVGPAADVYALGVILFELITGKLPFPGDSVAEVMRQIVEDEPPSLSRIAPTVPRDMQTVCAQCLRKSPTDRYHSAAALADDLRRFQEDRPVLARPIRSPERLVRWCSRNRGATSLIAGLFVLTGVAGCFAWLFLQRKSHGDRLLYASEMRQAFAAWENGDLSRIPDVLERQPRQLRHFEWRYLDRQQRQPLKTYSRPAHFLAPLSDDRHVLSAEGDRITAWNVDDGVVRWTRTFGGGPVLVDVRTDGTRIAVAAKSDSGHDVIVLDSDNRECGRVGRLNTSLYSIGLFKLKNWVAVGTSDSVKLFDFESGALVRSIPTAGWAVHFAITPDDRRIVVQAETEHLPQEEKTTTAVFDVDTGEMLATGETDKKLKAPMSFSPDGRQFLVGGGKNVAAAVFDRSGTAAKSVLSAPRRAEAPIAWSADGRRFATCGDGIATIWDATNARVLQTIGTHTRPHSAIAFCSTGRRLLTASREEGCVKVWDATIPRAWRLEASDPLSAFTCAFSPDGNEVVSGGRDGLLRRWGVPDGKPRQSLPCVAQTYAVSYSPDGQWLAAGGGGDPADGEDFAVRLWQRATPGTPRLLKFHTDWIWKAVFSPDSRLLATTGSDSRIAIWDVATGSILRTFQLYPQRPKGVSKRVCGLAWHPNGRQVVTGCADRCIYVWDIDLPKDEPLHTLSGHTDEVFCVAFSCDGGLLASGSLDKSIGLWATNSWEPVARMTGHTKDVWSVAFFPDGKRLASSAWDGTVRLWDVSMREEVMCFSPHKADDKWNRIDGLAISPDGAWIACAIEQAGPILIDGRPR